MAKPKEAMDPRREEEGWEDGARNLPAKTGAAIPARVEEHDDAIGALLGQRASIEVGRRVTRWRRLWWLLALIPLAVLLTPILLWTGYQSAHVTSQNAAVRGQLAELGSRLNGIVERVYVDVGDRVEAGDVLAQLHDRHLVAEVQEAQAEIGGLETTIEVERQAIELERRQLVQERAESQAKVDVAEAQARAARVDVDDATRAYELRESLHSSDGAVSSEDVRAAESERRGAQARFEEAQANAIAARSARERVLLINDALAIREQRIGVLQADLLRAQARLARAEADLEGTVIRAPEDGAILRRIVQPGGSVEVGQPILSMWLGQDLWVDAWIEEEDIGAVRIGSAATVTFHSLGGREFAGQVDKIGLATDLEIPESEVPQPRGERMRGAPVVGVRIRLADPPAELLPGLSATVAIEKGE